MATTSSIEPELNALVATAREAATLPVSSSTRKRFSVAINHLTVTLRSLRADTHLPTSSPSVADFLLHTLPRTLAVFNASFATYEHNEEVCRQTVVFLGLLTGVPPPQDVSASTKIALGNLRQATVQCFFALAQRGRREDVRALLNALLLVAAGANIRPRPGASLAARLRRLAIPRWGSELKLEDHFVVVLKALLTGWVASRAVVGQWSTVKFLDIAEGISVSLSMRVEKTADGKDLRAIVSGLADLCQSASFKATEGPEGIVLLAFASGILRSLEKSGLGLDDGLIGAYAEVMTTIVAQKDLSLNSYPERQFLDMFASEDNETLSVAFLVCRAANSLCDRFSRDQLAALRSLLEILVQSAARMDRNKEGQRPLVYQQLLWCVNSYSVMLGQAYASFVTKEGKHAECVHFLHSLISENPANAAVERFVLTTALKCEGKPTDAVAFVDLLSFISSRTLEVLALNRIPSISRDAKALTSACGLLIMLIDCASSPMEHVRILFLLSVVRMAIAHRSRNFNELPKVSPEPGEEEKSRKFWMFLVKAIQRSLIERSRAERYVGECIAFLKEVLRSPEATLAPARAELVKELPSILLDKYVFKGDMKRGRLMQTASVLDVLADTVTDCDLVGLCLENIICISTGLSEQHNRIVGVLLLRFMGRCKVEIFEVALSGLEKFIGEDEERKVSFLPLSRVAVLGTDMLRKNCAVEWLLDFFGEVSGMGVGVDISKGLRSKL